MKQFLLCDSAEHAELVDLLVLEWLRESRGTFASQWSGVFVKPNDPVDLYGILWASPVSELFHMPVSKEYPEGDPSMVLMTEVLDENGISDWELLPAAAIETSLI